jgi:outer membrane protein OmpA-like peptidoglycan-associated protein
MQLSEARAKAVRNYLITKNINSGRITYKGFGEKKPLVAGNSKSARMLNRRVEFVITKE